MKFTHFYQNMKNKGVAMTLLSKDISATHREVIKKENQTIKKIKGADIFGYNQKFDVLFILRQHSGRKSNIVNKTGNLKVAFVAK